MKISKKKAKLKKLLREKGKKINQIVNIPTKEKNTQRSQKKSKN